MYFQQSISPAELAPDLSPKDLIQRAGFDQVMNLTGGFDAWRACGLPEAPTSEKSKR